MGSTPKGQTAIGGLTVFLFLTGCAHQPEGSHNALASDSKATSTPRVVPWRARQYQFVERQLTDFTCGAASLSTIAKHFLELDIPEPRVTEIIKSFYDDEGWKTIERDGLRLLDIKNAASKIGLAAEGYRLTLEDLSRLKGPIIVHLRHAGFQHYSVVKGISGDRVFLADPLKGNIRMPVFDFLEQWSGISLIVWDKNKPIPDEHPLKVKRYSQPPEYDVAREVLRPRHPDSLVFR